MPATMPKFPSACLHMSPQAPKPWNNTADGCRSALDSSRVVGGMSILRKARKSWHGTQMPRCHRAGRTIALLFGCPVALECRVDFELTVRGRITHGKWIKRNLQFQLKSLDCSGRRARADGDTCSRAANRTARSGGAGAGPTQSSAEAAGAACGRRSAAGGGCEIDARADRETCCVRDEADAFFVDGFEA